MSKRVIYIATTVIVLLNLSLADQLHAALVTKHIFEKNSLIQVPFIENKNETNNGSSVFQANTYWGEISITKDGKLIYTILPSPTKGSQRGCVIEESFTGGTSYYTVSHGETSQTTVNFFKGSDPLKWRKCIPTYDSIKINDVYDGIDVILRVCGRNVEKLFYIEPGKDAQKIKLKVDGIKSMLVNDSGDIEMQTILGTVKMTKPVAFQIDNGKKEYIEISYRIQGQQYSFNIGDYDKKKILVIDPLLSSTFLGGSDQDYGRQVALDSNGNVFVAGYTYSSNFPLTPGTFDITNIDQDVFISKLDSNLSTLLSSTFLGGSIPGSSGAGWIGPNAEYAHDLILDSSDNVYIVGKTGSSDFPTTPGAYDGTYNGGHYDGFISKFNNTLQNLLSSTFLGSSVSSFFGGIDSVNTITIDVNSNIYVAGTTDGADFPTTTGIYDETHNGNDDAFVAKLNSNLTNLIASTYLGSSATDWIHTITSYNTYIFAVGFTNSSSFPTTLGAYDETHNGSTDGFICKFTNDLQSLQASTFVGGSQSDEAQSVTISSGDLIVSGMTESSNFPTTPDSYNTVHSGGGNDAFVLKIDGQLQNLLASALLGGNNTDSCGFVTIGGDGSIFVSGRTSSSNFPVTPGAFDTTYPGDSCIYVSKLDFDVQSLISSTYIDADADYIADKLLALDSGGNVYVIGNAGSSFPTTPGAYDTTHNGGGNDAVVLKLDNNLSDNGLIDLGACCIDGECSITSQAACLEAKGTWLGPGADCDPNPCQQSTHSESIPTFSEWGYMIFIVLLAAVGVLILRRHKIRCKT